jgi:hypothetical protein
MHLGTTRNYNPYVFAEAITRPEYMHRESKIDSSVDNQPIEHKPPKYLNSLIDAFRSSGNKLSGNEIKAAVGKHMGIDSISMAVDPWLLIYEDDKYDKRHPERYHVLNTEVL